MKYVYMNDKTKRIGIHSASLTDKHYLEPCETVVIEIPEDTIPFIKVWDNDQVLLTYADKGSY